MKELLDKSNINNIRLRRYIFTITAHELSSLSEPCYFPNLKKYYYELLNICNLNERDITSFVKRFYKGTPAANWKLHTDPKNNFYIFLMYYFLLNNDQVAYSSIMTFYNIRNYANLIRKHLPKFCKEDFFKYAIERLTGNHLFSREKTISGGLYFLSNELQKRYTNYIASANIEGITKFITEARHRVSQSVKSFAETYYSLIEKGVSIMKYDEEEYNKNQIKTLKQTAKIVEDTVSKITIYKFIDKKALEYSTKITKVKFTIAELIANRIIDTKYTDNIRIILNMFIKEVTETNEICGHEYFYKIKFLMSLKRSNKPIYFKQQILVLLFKIIDEINYREQFESLGVQTKFSIASFLAYYLTGILRNTVC